MANSLREDVEALVAKFRHRSDEYTSHGQVLAAECALDCAADVRTTLTSHPPADGVEMSAKYYELILAVGNKHPGESRHETALRYIRQSENNNAGPAQADAILSNAGIERAETKP